MEAELVVPSSDYKESFLEALREYPSGQEDEAKDNLGVMAPVDDFDAFVQYLKDRSDEKLLPADTVPQTVYWLVKGSLFIGRITIRHRLNEHLMNYAGHMGYGIRPSERSKGYGNLILKLGLQKVREMGISKVLLVCSKANIASRKIIENNGGVFENEVTNKQGVQKLRFWITTV